MKRALVCATLLLSADIQSAPNLSVSNLVYVKIPKTASTTTAGVVRRIAFHHRLSGFRGNNWIGKEPGVWANHAPRSELQDRIRKLRLPAVLVSMLRNPAERCLSSYYHFRVSMHGTTPSDKAKLRAVKDCSDVQFKYLRRSNETDSVQAVFRDYNFLGVAHRYEESALMLARACGAADADALYLNAKVADGRPAAFSFLSYNFTTHPPLSEEPAEVKAYVASDAYRRANARDLELLRLAEKRIAAWAAQPDSVKALRRFEAMQARVVMTCDPGDFCSATPHNERVLAKAAAPASVVPPGRRLDQGCTDPRCFWGDNGCGYECMDAVALNWE